MKKELIKQFASVQLSFLRIALVFCVFILLEGCLCGSVCQFYGNMIKRGTNKSCDDICDERAEAADEERRKKRESQASTSTNPGSDSVESVGNPIPQKKAPGKVDGPLSGEYFTNTISVGPNLNFKSSEEEYTYGESKHQPGIGMHISLGSAFPFNNKWGMAGTIGFKQNSASEKMEYNEPGGGASSEFKDTYKYNYITGTLLGEYWVTSHLAIAAGPEINYLVSASRKSDGSSGSGDKEDIKESSLSFGVDAKLGLKYEIPRGNRRSKWGISLIYDHRLSRLNKKEDNGFAVAAYRMKSINLGLSYFICRKCGAPGKPSANSK